MGVSLALAIGVCRHGAYNCSGSVVSHQSLSPDELRLILQPAWALSVMWSKTIPYDLSQQIFCNMQPKIFNTHKSIKI